MEKPNEVLINYFDDEYNAWTVDVYFGGDDDEGIVAAYIFEKSYKVLWVNNAHRANKHIASEIDSFVKESISKLVKEDFISSAPIDSWDSDKLPCPFCGSRKQIKAHEDSCYLHKLWQVFNHGVKLTDEDKRTAWQTRFELNDHV